MSDEKRTYSDTIPMSRAELNAALKSHGYAEIPEPYETRIPPCQACADAAISSDENDEYPIQSGCSWCHGSGSMTPVERRNYLESQNR